MATRAKAQKPEIPEPYLGKSHAAGYDMDSQGKNTAPLPIPEASRQHTRGRSRMR
jgi:hypothetical protein